MESMDCNDDGQATRPVTDKLATRQRILGAALVLIEEQGYDQVTMSEIAARAGTSRANLYLHFGSRTQIVRARMKDLEEEAWALYEALAALDDFELGPLLVWLAEARALWQHYRYQFEAIERATTVDDDVLDEWLAMQRRVTRRFSVLVVPGLPVVERQRWEARTVALMLGLERIYYVLYVRGHAEWEEYVLEGLALQWRALLTDSWEEERCDTTASWRGPERV